MKYDNGMISFICPSGVSPEMINFHKRHRLWSCKYRSDVHGERDRWMEIRHVNSDTVHGVMLGLEYSGAEKSVWGWCKGVLWQHLISMVGDEVDHSSVICHRLLCGQMRQYSLSELESMGDRSKALMVEAGKDGGWFSPEEIDWWVEFTNGIVLL